MELESLTKIIQPLTVSGRSDVDVTGITCDSRRVRPGYLFVAVKGLHEDGARYISDAVERGAVAVVSEHTGWSHPRVAHVCVEDSRRALSEISCAYYGDPAGKMQVVGVTGTNGKTTITYMVRHILQAAGRKPGLVGTVCYEMGDRRIPATRTTPEAPELQAMLDKMVQAGCRSVAMEVSSHALDQKRVWGIDFDVGVFSNLSRDHLDYHGTLEQYFAAKARLFRGLGQMKKKAVAAVNIDDPWGMRLAGIHGFRVQCVTYGSHPTSMVRADEVELGPSGSTFKLVTPWGGARVQLPLMGRFNISNALAAATACGSLGIDPRLIAEVLSDMGPVPGRLERIPNHHGLHVYVDYAHTPDALHQVLATLREVTEGRVLTVFGCGGDRDVEKRAQMGAIAAQGADYSIITNDNPRSEDPAAIARAIRSGFRRADNVEIVLERDEAIAKAIGMAEKGDVVLIAGKGHENYQQFANTVVSFDDREVARAVLKE
jgi:UDP-N-acetylmuramoyl-L-alanyl-D-glutamate--2,6-diaminopimelate ligase